MVILIIFLLIIVYFIIGRVIIQYLYYNDLIHLDEDILNSFFIVLIFPIVVIWVLIKIASDCIIEILKIY